MEHTAVDMSEILHSRDAQMSIHQREFRLKNSTREAPTALAETLLA